ncbi:MAG: hypothetical protein PHV59_09565, partial [Victivallales bacterium]|nr:hypothetical protein [Victivallales bacterium]
MSEELDKKRHQENGSAPYFASDDIEKTQKIDFDYRELIGRDSSSLHGTALENSRSADISERKTLFLKKSVPDDYVKSDSVISQINSIPKLERELKLQDIYESHVLEEKIAEGAQGVI